MTPDGKSVRPASPDTGRWSRLLRRRPPGFYALVSLLILAPCHWQPRVQAGDLSSHIYNSWLAQLIESGRIEGLVIVRQGTNILFDLLLSGFFKLFGAEAAQRLAVSIAVLVFVWGAFAFASAVSRRQPWHLLPCLVMFAYGWVFHMGFFNFYLSLGLCFWALAAVWRPTRRKLLATASLFVLAYMAHALPVAWSVALIGYLVVARRIAPRRRIYLTACSLLAIGVLHVGLTSSFISHWSPQQVSVSTGADQLWVFGQKYYGVLVGLLLLWGLSFLDVLRAHGARRTVFGIPFQFCVLSAASVIALPSTILLPGFHHSLVYIAERMSLGVGVCVVALLACAKPHVWTRYGMTGLALVFFVFLYADERALNNFEDKMQGVIAQLPAGQRVVSGVTDQGSRVNALAHTIDRVCVGRCFSYANYEPSTAQFRIRAAGRNRVVVANYADSYALQTGKYILKEEDPPILQVEMDGRGALVVKLLKAGTQCRTTPLKVFPDLTFLTPPDTGSLALTARLRGRG